MLGTLPPGTLGVVVVLGISGVPPPGIDVGILGVVLPALGIELSLPDFCMEPSPEPFGFMEPGAVSPDGIVVAGGVLSEVVFLLLAGFLSFLACVSGFLVSVTATVEAWLEV